MASYFAEFRRCWRGLVLCLGFVGVPVACEPPVAMNGDWPESTAVLENADAALKAGDSAVKSKAWDEAFEQYRKADDIRYGTVGAARWTTLGDLIASIGDVFNSDPVAMKAYARALKADPKYPGIHLGQARVLMHEPTPNPPNALAALDEEEQAHPGSPDVRKLRQKIQAGLDAEKRAEDEKQAIRDKFESDRAQRQLEGEHHEETAKDRYRTQSVEARGIFCRLEGYRVFGDEFDGEYHTSTASGTFAGALLQCVNNTKRSLYFPASDFTMVDTMGRRFAIDASSSFDLAIWKSDRSIANPEALQLHPGSPRFVQLMFDLPPEVAAATTTRLVFANKGMQVVFDGDAAAAEH